MSFFRRILSSDYRQALAAEAAGDYEEAARRYALAGERAKVAEMHVLRAQKAQNRADEVASLRDAAHWADAGAPVRGRAMRALGLALLERARSEGVATTRDRQALAEAARCLEEAGEHGAAGEACELAGDDEAAARAYERGGLVEKMEAALAREQRRLDVGRRLTGAFGDYETAMRSGDRDAARAALLACCEAAEQKGDYRRLLDELDGRRLTGWVTLRRVADARVVVICGGGSLVLGRGPDLPLPLAAPGVSRAHAEVTFSNSHWILRDAGSRAGTWLEDLPVMGQVHLEGQGRFRLGDVCEIDFRAGTILRLEIARGPSRGAALLLAEAGETLELDEELGLPAAAGFRDGRPHLFSDSGVLALNGSPSGSALELIRRDVITSGGIEVEVV